MLTKPILGESATSLEAAIQETVTSGSKIKTDGWRGCNGLKSLGYDHEIVRKTEDVGENLTFRFNRRTSKSRGLLF